MINLNIVPDDDKSTLFQEGILEDSLKGAADIDVDKIKDDWKNADRGIYDKAKSLNDEGIKKGKDQADAIDRVLKKNVVDTRSIIARARNSVLQFPIYVPQTIRVNEAHIIGQMFERVYTTLVQTVLSQNPIMDEEEANNLVFLKQFHTNLKESANALVNKYYEPIDNIDRMMCESIFHTQKLTESCTVEFKVIPCTNKDLILENARLMNEPLSGFMYLREAKDATETTKEASASYRTINEDELREMAMDRAKFTEREKRAIKDTSSDIESELKKSMQNKTDAQRKEALEHRLSQKSDANHKLEDAIKDLKSDIKSGKISNCSYADGRYRRYDKNSKTIVKPAGKTPVNDAVDAPKILRDSDIKKINGLLPYTIEATFRIRTKQGLDRDIRYVIGIKSVLHIFRTQDLAEDLRELVTGNIKTLQKVRYKTGEISFKDYFFNIKGLKADAAKHVNYDKRWINTLKRLGEYQKMNGTLMKKSVQAITGGDVPIPNGTLVLAQTDVTTLIDKTGIDLSVVSNAKRLARSLFLIGVVIIDSTRGTMRVLFPDSDNEWDVQSLGAIDAELAKTDNSQLMRELNHMVNK